jgi:hypothetical protein
LERDSFVSAKASSVWVHRTVRWCTGQCPVVHRTVSGGAPDSVRVRQAGSCELATLGISSAAYDYNSPDCPVCTGLSGELTVGRANGRLRDLRETRGRANGREGAPDCPVCTGQCPVHQRLLGANGRLRHRRKEICTGQCPVVHRTVWCTRRQKARIAFLECSQWLLAALGL